ncbi:MAG TPA: M1 family aminopeptidase, partial [Dehalococcoidia bacterium]|nr:M1 family aminopeptidase [Dehalococcoidia bacterium]
VADSLDGLPVPYYVEPGREDDARRAFGRTPEMIRFFQERIGVPYPYEKYAQVAVADFIFGGMENTSATTMTDTILYDERAAIDMDRDSLVAHELAHQWFGDLLTCKEWAHAWLNEGFATYFDLLFLEHHKGQDEFAYGRFQNATVYFGEDSGHYRRPIVQRVYHEPIDIFDRHLYEKGSLVLHMLRYVLGDELWWKAIRHYTTKHAQGVVSTPDFQRAIEEATGRNLDQFFDQWVYKGGHPEYKVSWSWDDETRVATLNVSQQQKTDDLTPVFAMPFAVDFRSGEQSREFRVMVDQAEQTLHFPLDWRPDMVRFDPGNHVLKTLDFDKPVDELIRQLDHDPDPMGRIHAALALGKKGGTKATEALAACVRSDAFWGVRAEAAKALGSMRTEAALTALAALSTVEHPKARRGVVRALGEFRHSERAAHALLPLLQSDPSYFVEGEAALSLGKTRSVRAYDAITAAFAKESYNETIRVMACSGLAELRDERAIDFLLGWVPYGKPQQVRSAAISALATLGGHVIERKKEIADALIGLLNDPWLRTRLAAADALGKLGDGAALGPLDEYASRELDGRGVRIAREAMAAIREGTSRDDELRKLREDLDRSMAENRDLRSRLDKIEAQLNGRQDGRAAAIETMNA